jgi:hypothetical protein
VNSIDWRYLQQPLIIFILAVIVATSMAVVGYQYESAQIKKYDKAVETLRTTHTRYINMVKDIDLLEQYRNLYSGYKSSGLIGEERRLSWIESLENTNKVLKLPTLSYSLLPQEKFIRPGLKVKSGVELSGSAMELTMGLLHEEDILAVLEGLRLSIKNLFTVESCSLSRSGKVGVPLNTKKTNLRSECTIRWVTINVK